MAAKPKSKKVALVFCQRCGHPLPQMDPIDAKAVKVTDPLHPNKTQLGRIDLIFRCPNCREKLILLQQHVKTFEIAEGQVEKTLQLIKKEKQDANQSESNSKN